MKGYTAALASGEAIHYVDRKRWLWLLSVIWPLKPFVGIWLHAETGNELPLLLSTTKAERVDGGYRFTGHKAFGSLSPVWTRPGSH